MLAAVIEGPGAVVVRDTAPPRAAGLALVRVTQAGICGTDRTLAAGGIAVRPPRVLGHEMRPGGDVARLRARPAGSVGTGPGGLPAYEAYSKTDDPRRARGADRAASGRPRC